MTDRRAGSLVVTPVAIKGIVGVEIDMGIRIDMTAVVIDEMVGIRTTESGIDHVVPREDLVALYGTDWKENEMIDIKDPDHFLGVAGIEINSKSEIMAGIVSEIETEIVKESAMINIRILYQKV